MVFREAILGSDVYPKVRASCAEVDLTKVHTSRRAYVALSVGALPYE